MNKTKKIQSPTPEKLDEFIEPCFLGTHLWIKEPPTNNVNKIADYLSHRVSKIPLDLTSHAQRIRLYLALKDSDATYAALLDLFIVLGSNGALLRKRLLHQASQVISTENYQFVSLMPSGVSPISSDTPLSHLAVLSLSRTTENKIIRKIDNEIPEKTEDAVVTAKDLINSGQIEQARSLLESILIKEPERTDASEELLQIYRHTHDRDSCVSMLKKLSSSSFAAHDQWVELIITLDQHATERSLSA